MLPSIATSLDVSIVIAYSLLATVSYIIFSIFRRIYFHPLSHVPGPKLAAATWFYQSYYSLWNGSKYYLQIEKLHKLYGPVVRINPGEVHLSDPDNFETIYRVGSKFSKNPRQYDAFSVKYSTFATGPNDVHRQRRAALNPFFARKMVLELEQVVQDKVEKLCMLVRKASAKREKANLHLAFRAISVDVASDYTFGQSYALLDSEDIGDEFLTLTSRLGPSAWVFQQFPGLLITSRIPLWILKKISDPLALIVKLRELTDSHTRAVESELKSGTWSKENSRRTIFHELLTPNLEAGYVVPSIESLQDEGMSIIAGAADTTGNAMTVAAYNVLQNPAIHEKLKAELREAFPDPSLPLEFQRLEKLPYLTAVVKEGLRLSFGVISRLGRVVPEGGATFNDYHLPEGTAVSMSFWMMHQDPIAFPDPFVFDPERWLGAKNASRMEKSFVPFSKGTRQCVGMPLAYCELYITLGTLFRRFENLKCDKLSAYDTSYIDHFASFVPADAAVFKVYAG